MTISTSTTSDRFASFRSLVPVTNKSTYLNSSFQPPMNTLVYDSIKGFIDASLTETSPKQGFVAQAEETRTKVATLLNTTPENIAFTRDTTEGLNIFQRSIKWSKGDNVVILANEHPNQGFGWLGLASEGLEIRLIQVDESDDTKPFNAEDFVPHVDDNTRAIGISSVMFHSGLRNDVKSLVQRFKHRGIHILVDATQEIGFGEVDVQQLGVSAIAFGVHKGLNTPSGLGILYVERDTMALLKEVPPLLCGGSISNLKPDLTVNEDFEVFDTALRFEHLNKPLLQCIALGTYVDLIQDIGIKNIQTYLEQLGSYFRAQMRSIGIETAGPDKIHLRSPHSNVIPLFGSGWAQHFIENDVVVSQYRCGTRISLGIYNNKEDVDKFVAVVKQGLSNGLKK